MKYTVHLMSLTAFALSVFVSPGCRTTDPNYVEIQKHWSSGNTQAASMELLANATKEKNPLTMTTPPNKQTREQIREHLKQQ